MDRAQAAADVDRKRIIAETFAEHLTVLQGSIEMLQDSIDQAAGLLIDAYRAEGKAILFGNGGSMTDALHVEGELVNRFAIDRPGVAAVALAAPASLTATANDYAYEDVFARMLVAHARPGDVALGFTTSGNSENVIRAFAAARTKGLATVALTGEGGGRCVDLVDVCLMVPSRSTPRIQEIHITIGHMLCDLVERAVLAG
jgi:D-sedoheptulose 7-phosphate isomerase